ncbi:hypothetical protein [Azorhizophilus paspali]|uniref:ODP domain-containing protein n=1 Tax=Azorhizophilus paspali TaxID=69963 RepID=A0ABV6SIK0_AZOPA
MLLGPGDDLACTPLSLELSKGISLQALTYIFALHQAPDSISSQGTWLLHIRAKVLCSRCAACGGT